MNEKFNEKNKLHGHYTIEAYDKHGRLVETYEIDNLLTTSLYTLIFNALNYDVTAQTANALNINFMATGTGTAPLSQSDTKMSAELFRKAPSSKAAGAGIFTCKFLLATTESIGTITELGVFCNGTSTADSGTLISHASCNIVKTAAVKYLMTWGLTLA
jgi:hypothetical protein